MAAASIDAQLRARKTKPQVDKALSKMNDHDIEESEQNIKDYLRQKANKQRFNNMIKHQRI